MKTILASLCFALTLASCEEVEISSAQIVEDSETKNLFVNFYDSSRPTVFATPDGTDIRGKSFHVTVQHVDGEYSGYMVKRDGEDIALIGDESGEGLMNVVISKDGQRWIGKWEITEGEPSVKFTKAP